MKHGVQTSKLEAIKQEFSSMVAGGVSKSIALDKIVAKHPEINSLFLRLTFHTAAGWNI